MTENHTGQVLIDAVRALQTARSQFDTYGRTGAMGVTRKLYRDREIEAQRAVVEAAEAFVANPRAAQLGMNTPKRSPARVEDK